MIDWEEVSINLKVITSSKGNLETVLKKLYYKKKLSLREISDLTLYEASDISIRKKMKELGLPLRGRGGPNYKGKPTPTVTLEEYLTSTETALAKRHGTGRAKIHKIAKTKGWPLKTPGGTKIPQHFESPGSAEESH